MLILLILTVRIAYVVSHGCVCDKDLGLYTETNEYIDCDDIDTSSCDLRSIKNRCCVTCDACKGEDDGHDSGGDDGGSSSDGGSSCFAADERILTNQGYARMQDLPQMENVLVQAIDEGGVLTFVPIQIWIHKNPEGTNYLKISTETDEVLTISPLHLVFTVPCVGNPIPKAVFAKRVEPGQCVLTTNENGATPTRVTKVDDVYAPGQYAFTTKTGNVVVNKVVASTYSQIEYQDLQHGFFQLLFKMKSLVEEPVLQGMASSLTREWMNPVVDLMYEGFKGL